MSEANNSDSSNSEYEISSCSSDFNPLKALYSKKVNVPVEGAPLYENIAQYESAQKGQKIIPVGNRKLVQKKEEEKAQAKLQRQKELEEINKNRFSQYQGLTTVPRPRKATKNVLTRMQQMEGPLAALKACVDQRIRVKVLTRTGTGIRGELHGTLLAFDKQWNLAMQDVQEVWRRRASNKRKVVPVAGTAVPRGTAAKISPVPQVVEKCIGKDLVECTRHMKQMMVRGEHVVLVNIVDR